MKHISAGVNTDIHTKLIKTGILWFENGSNGYLRQFFFLAHSWLWVAADTIQASPKLENICSLLCTVP